MRWHRGPSRCWTSVTAIRPPPEPRLPHLALHTPPPPCPAVTPRCSARAPASLASRGWGRGVGLLAGAPRSWAHGHTEVEVSAATGSRTHAGPAGMMAPPASDQLGVKVGARFTVWDAAAPCEAVGGEKKKKVFISLPNRDLPSNAFCNGKGGWYGTVFHVTCGPKPMRAGEAGLRLAAGWARRDASGLPGSRPPPAGGGGPWLPSKP